MPETSNALKASVRVSLLLYLHNLFYHLFSTARSPIYNHVNITISGLASIRAYGAQAVFERQFHRYLDDHSGIWYHYLSFSKFIGIIIDWIVVLYIASITLSVMLTPELAGGYAGLAISSGLLLSGITQYGVR